MAITANLCLVPCEPLQSSSVSLFPVSSSSSSFFFTGGTNLWAHRKFSSLAFSSSSCQFNKKLSARRFGRLVVAAADYYSTLGVSKSASGKEIKAAFRKLARQVWYPLGNFF